MSQDNFRKCSRCHRFSEIFRYVINRQMNTNSRIFVKSRIEYYFKNEKYMTKINRKYKIREILNCDMTKTLVQDF